METSWKVSQRRERSQRSAPPTDPGGPRAHHPPPRPAPLRRRPPPIPTPDDPSSRDRDLHVQPWIDPVIDEQGHDPRSAYVERFWLPVLGPSTTWLLRRLADRLEAEPDGFDVRLSALGAELGLALRRNPKASPLERAVDRACTFGAARLLGDSTFVVRRRLAPLSRRQVHRLPDRLRHEHDRWDEDVSRGPTAAEVRQRARTLALSLLQLGETERDAERQLHRWHVHPAVAHEAMRWARERHTGATGG